MLNNSGVVPIGSKNRSSQIVTTILTPAGTPGAKYPISQAGDNFYLVLATGSVTVRPNRGQVNTYSQGTGLESPDAPFDYVEIGNPSSNNLVVSIFVGFGGYIDNRLIVSDPLLSKVSFPTYPVENALTEVPILDKTAQAITDQNGNNFLALTREAIYITNLDLAVTYYLLSTAGTGAVGAVAPGFSAVFPFNGDFVLAPNGSGNVNALVSELYTSVRPTIS